MAHWSSCSIHNEPALPKGECDCGNDAPEMSGKLLDGTLWTIRDGEVKSFPIVGGKIIDDAQR